jgi:hypothetical protein
LIWQAIILWLVCPVLPLKRQVEPLRESFVPFQRAA